MIQQRPTTSIPAAGDPPRRRRPGGDAGRLLVVLGGVFLLLLILAVRLVKIQVIDGGDYAELARRQYESKVELQAERGPIYDRNGHLLASNGVSLSFAVDPRHVERPSELARAFAEVFGETKDHWFRRITQKNTQFVWLRRKVSGPALERLRRLDDNGLLKLKEPLRRFEFGSTGGQVIGATSVDNAGLNGIELYYEKELRGRDGYMVMQRDARGRRRPDADLPQVAPEHGNGLVLTLDINMQSILEEELRRGVESAGAASGTAIAMDPRTGEILAMSSWPTFDPNDLAGADPAGLRLRAITDMYEPGSTMKIVPAAAALEEGLVDPDEEIDAEGGLFQLANHAIRDDHADGLISFRHAMEHSSNIVMAKVASRIPTPRFYKYVRDFGFGIVTGLDLPGEVKGEVKKPSEFTEGTQEFMAFGYQLAVTPLQLLAAYAAIANDGVMMRPHLLKRRLDRDGNVVEEIEPQEVRQVVGSTTAKTLRDLLVGVVERGTGRAAAVPGLSIAGKTGTAQKIDGGEYSKEKYNASFVGFFPAEEPEIALLVLLDSPTNGYYGGQVAGPIFREIARRIAGVAPPSLLRADAPKGEETEVRPVSELPATIALPDVRGTGGRGARQILEASGCRVLMRGNGPLVVAQQPAAGTKVERHAVVTLMLGDAAPSSRMADLRGLSLRRAISLLTAAGLRPRVQGGGVVRRQEPSAGSAVARGGEVLLVCSEEE